MQSSLRRHAHRQQEVGGCVGHCGGHRRVPESSVRAWIKEREAKAQGSDYHAVAEENGMYDIPETAFIEASKRRRS